MTVGKEASWEGPFSHRMGGWIELRTDQTVMQWVGSADLLCNSPAGVIKGAATKTLKGDQEGGNGQLSLWGDNNDHGKSQHRLSLFLL